MAAPPLAVSALALRAAAVLAACALAGCGSDAPNGAAAAPGGAGDAGASTGAGAGGDDAGSSDTCPVDVAPAADVVVTTRGAIHGALTASGASVAFRGVPYAAPPIGALRFREPAPHACWSGVREATAYGSSCPQAGGVGDEDCLTLNVWVPRDALPTTGGTASSGAALPVLFFVHGGAEIGGGSDAQIGAGNLYDGSAIAEREHVVVVTTNYRLGALGFLAHAALDAEDARHRSGNYGILDLVASLQWVQHNVAAFGGDPAHVLLFGESAGAANTCILTASPLGKGLFSAALMESGGCAAPPLADREKVGAAVAAAVGCTTGDAAAVAACLRSKAPSDLVNARPTLGDLLSADLVHTWDMPYGANVDGYVLTEDPLAAIRGGRYNHVPFAIGSNADEMELFVPQGTVLTCGDYETQIRQRTGTLASQVLSLYPCAAYPFPRWALVAVGTDAAFTCEARRVARALARSPNAPPVFRYWYTHARDYGPLAAERAFHSAELPFVFRTWSNEGYVATPGEAALSDAIQGYWARFARAGDPNGGGALAWPRYDATTDPVVVLDDTLSTANGVADAKCDFWDSVSP